MKKFKQKMNQQNGSAMVLVVIIIAILLIFIPFMNKQISHQFRSTQRSYDDISEKYIAESGVERTISDIEKQLSLDTSSYSLYRVINHNPYDQCPKVDFNESGEPDWGNYWGDSENTFYKLIYYQIIDKKTNEIYNQVLNENWKKIFNSDSEIRTYYEDNILGLMKILIVQHNKSYIIDLENNVNKFINMMENAKIAVSQSNGKDEDKSVAITGYNTMIEYILELKCRLGMADNSTSNDIENKKIEIPYYDVTINDKDNLEFKKNNEKTEFCYIDIIKVNGKITGMNLSELNKKFIGASGYKYSIRADIDFIFSQTGSSYSIDQNINSYDRVN